LLGFREKEAEAFHEERCLHFAKKSLRFNSLRATTLSDINSLFICNQFVFIPKILFQESYYCKILKIILIIIEIKVNY